MTTVAFGERHYVLEQRQLCVNRVEAFRAPDRASSRPAVFLATPLARR